MKKITNVGIQPLVLNPGSVSLPPGVEVDVENWDALKKHPITKFYLDNGTLSLDGAPGGSDDESERKDDLIARIKDLGGKATKASSVDKLEAQLVEAQQRASIVEALRSLEVEYDDKATTDELQELLAKNNNPAE